jgi:hypothetical protein
VTIPADVTIWIQEDSILPTGYLNARGRDIPFPVIDLDGAKLRGLNGDPVPYLRRLAEVASRLADELVAARAAADAAAVPL